MRPIKIRARRLDNGEWVHGVPIPNSYGDRVFFIPLSLSDKIAYPFERLVDWVIEVDKETISQYTGLDDKNGVPIWENDSVINHLGQVGRVIYLIQEAGFVVSLDNSDYRLGHRNTGEGYTNASLHEVISN